MRGIVTVDEWSASKDYNGVLESIEQECITNIPNWDETGRMILVHPTPHTEKLIKIARESNIFRSLCNAICSSVNVMDMYSSALYTEMFPEGVMSDGEHKLFKAMVDIFSQSQLLLKIVTFFHDAIQVGETLGWFPVKRGKDGEAPIISKDYVLVYLDWPHNKWVAKSLWGEDIEVVFLHTTDALRPQSTVSIMAEREKERDMVYSLFLQSLQFATKPSYLLLQNETDMNEENKKEATTATNQEGMNRYLESIIREHKISVSSTQKMVSEQNDIRRFLSSMGASQIENNKERKRLERELRILKEERDENVMGKPNKYFVPEGLNIPHSNLSVKPFDMLSFEKRHEREWTSACLGFRSPQERDNQDYSRIHKDSTGERLLFQKQKMYQEIIIHHLLWPWLKDLGISLLPSYSYPKSDISLWKDAISEYMYPILLSSNLGIPLHFLVRKKEGE